MEISLWWNVHKNFWSNALRLHFEIRYSEQLIFILIAITYNYLKLLKTHILSKTYSVNIVIINMQMYSDWIFENHENHTIFLAIPQNYHYLIFIHCLHFKNLINVNLSSFSIKNEIFNFSIVIQITYFSLESVIIIFQKILFLSIHIVFMHKYNTYVKNNLFFVYIYFVYSVYLTIMNLGCISICFVFFILLYVIVLAISLPFEGLLSFHIIVSLSGNREKTINDALSVSEALNHKYWWLKFYSYVCICE